MFSHNQTILNNQLYIQDLVGSVVRPVKELKAFGEDYIKMAFS